MRNQPAGRTRATFRRTPGVLKPSLVRRRKLALSDNLRDSTPRDVGPRAQAMLEALRSDLERQLNDIERRLSMLE